MFTITQAFCKVSSPDIHQSHCLLITKPASLLIDVAIATGLVAIAALALYSAAGGNLGMLNFLSTLGPTTAGVMVIGSMTLLGTDNVAFACVLLFSSEQKRSSSNNVQQIVRDEKQSGSLPLPSHSTPLPPPSPPPTPYSTPKKKSSSYTHPDSRIGNSANPGATDLRPAKQPISGGDMGDADGLKDGDDGAGKNPILKLRCAYTRTAHSSSSRRIADTPFQRLLKQIEERNHQLKPVVSQFPMLKPNQLEDLREKLKLPYARQVIGAALSDLQSFLENKLNSAPPSNPQQNSIVEEFDDGLEERDEDDSIEDHLSYDPFFDKFIRDILSYIFAKDTQKRIEETLTYLTKTVVPIFEKAKQNAAQAQQIREANTSQHTKRVEEEKLTKQKEESRRRFKIALSYLYLGMSYDISTLDVTAIESSIIKKTTFEQDLTCKLSEIKKLIASISAQKTSYESGNELDIASFEKICALLKNTLDRWKNIRTLQQQVALESCLKSIT